MGSTVFNFGKNVSWKPRDYFQPESEEQVLEILAQSDGRAIRVGGTRHSWSESLVSDDVYMDLSRIAHVEIIRSSDGVAVRVGAGCQIKHLLKELNKEDLTLPSVGLIAEQTIAGATSTGTHGSGRHSLSHYIQSARIASIAADGSAVIRDVTEGTALQAARCGLGCLGVVVELTLMCVDQYYVREHLFGVDTLGEVLTHEAEAPIQQFYLIPHTWRFVVQKRVVAGENSRSGLAGLYRLYWFVALDIGFHLLLKLFAGLLRSRRMVHFFFRRIAPLTTSHHWVATDRSDRQLTMKHDLFRHLELEIFVRRSDLADAMQFVKESVGISDGAIDRLSDRFKDRLPGSLVQQLMMRRAEYVHHYPICVRLVKPDDTLISMSEGGEEDWYAISFITYVEPRDSFCQFASFLAGSTFHLFGARIHWGKWFPLGGDIVEKQYDRLDDFRAVCRTFDPTGAFVNKWVQNKIGLEPGTRE